MKLKTNAPKSVSMLLVEDDGDILELLSSILAVKYPDVTLYTANNGRLGLELFKAHTSDIVITDINMSELCGVQMAEDIRVIKPETMIIATTGKSGEISVNGKSILRNSEGKMVEFDHVMVKPVNISELCSVINQFIGEI